MIVSKILSLKRSQKRLIVLLLDLLIVPFALWCSFSLRLGVFFSLEDLSFVPAEARGEVLYLFLIAPVIAIPIFIKFGLYRAIIRYIGFVAMWTIIKAVSTGPSSRIRARATAVPKADSAPNLTRV